MCLTIVPSLSEKTMSKVAYLAIPSQTSATECAHAQMITVS